MVKNIANFIKAFRAEGIKMKGTRIILTALVLGGFIPLISLIITLIKGNYNSDLTEQTNFFEESFSQLKFVLELIAALVAIISASRMAQIEYKNNTWQLIETQPLNKFSIYFSKYAKLLIINFITIVTFVFATFILSLVEYILQENKELASLSITFDSIQVAVRLWISLLFLSTLIYIVSIRFSNFILSIILGIGLIIASSILQVLNLMPKWYPLILTTNAISKPSDLGFYFTYSEGFSVVISILLLFIGYQWYANKTFKQAFLKNPKTIISNLAVIGVLGVFCFWILKPNQMISSNQTLISGTISSPDQINEGYLVDALTNDTIIKFGVHDYAFSTNIDEPLSLGKYQLKFDNGINTDLILSTNDFMNLEIEQDASGVNVKKTGTRLAENNLESTIDIYSNSAYYISNDIFADQPEKISETIIDDYKSYASKLARAYTNDNYIIRDDYRGIQQKQIIVHFLNLWNIYAKKTLVSNPEFKKEAYPIYKLLNDKLDRKDLEMLHDANYRQMVLDEITKQDTSDLDEATKMLVAISKLPNDAFKERLLTISLYQLIRDSKSSNEAMDLYNTYSINLTNSKNTNYLKNILNNTIRLSKGVKAPDFNAFNLEGKEVSLADFKEKYVVIDVWATWCAPCRVVSPSFEKMANTYKENNNIVFIALSVDKNKKAWMAQAKEKTKTVKQYIVSDIKTFGIKYAIESIPRFIFIDKAGNIINAKMPFANESAFDLYIESALKAN